MNKKKAQTALMIAAAAIFAAAAAVSVYQLRRTKPNTVKIISDGKVLYTLDLSRESDREIIVEYEGRRNVIVIENHDIYVREADCPDHTCIKMGKLSQSSTQIVCLPNKLMIRRAYSSEEGGTDGTA